MAANRYGQIWHGDHHHINIRFPSDAARLQFQGEFEAYHASHDHDGPVPVFKCVTTKDLKLSTGSRSPEDLVKAETDKDYRITIDGYSWSDIHSYHNPSSISDYSWYRVPTCCVPPTIVIGREFVDSGTLQRHPLSAIFGDMPADDFQSLIQSIQTDGFIEPIIRVYEGQILDGWHRYRAARELNLIRKLKFQEWDEADHRDGDPQAFVLARNIERRHYTSSQRAQIVITFNKRFGHGGDRSKSPVGDLKTRSDLAKAANVGTSTIDRAVQVEKVGRSKEVIAGKKTATQVLSEEKDVSGVYFIQSEATGHIKIGYSSQVNQRVSSLQAASSESMKILHIMEGKTKVDEFDLHERFKDLRIDFEWFRSDPALMEYIREAGQSEVSVISGEKTAGEVLEEQKAKADAEREAAIEAVKSRFDMAVSAWHTSQTDRLWKFEKLPVGRTPLIDSEYIKTYFELADPRIPQNTKPTAAHYEGAMECMLDHADRFAEQLEGRHYRRIIKDWDESVLPQLIKRLQGPLFGYSTSDSDAGALEVRIRKAIRDQYGFQGRITTQPFEVLFEITEDAHVVLLHLDPKEWVRDGSEIAWALLALPEPIKSLSEKSSEKAKPADPKPLQSWIDEQKVSAKDSTENISEENLEGLRKLIKAEMKPWKARDKQKCQYPSDHIGKASFSTLVTALRKYEESTLVGAATARELRDLLRLMKTDNFSFILEVRTVLSETAQADIDLQCAHGNAENDRRRVWIAFGESDISNAISKETFALSAAKQHDLYEDGYGSGENYLLGKDYAPIDKLTLKEAQQIRAFFNSVEAALKTRPDWIQVLMPKGYGLRVVGDELQEEIGVENLLTEDRRPTIDNPSSIEVSLWEAFNKCLPKWKAKYAESGYRENDLIQASTETELFDALRAYRGSGQEGIPTVAEIKDVTALMQSESYLLARHLRDLLRAKSDAQDEGQTEQDPFHDVDLADVKADLEALLKKVRSPTEKHPLYHQICEDIHDAYLEYENLPDDREIFAILLDCALAAIEEVEG